MIVAVAKFSIILGVLLVIGVSSQKDDDEGRPYEFAFQIDGEQHRYEKKDVNGIIQGEFGFITADGVYHVTVYATDENGSFKILSMKNIRISGPDDQWNDLRHAPVSPPSVKSLTSNLNPFVPSPRTSAVGRALKLPSDIPPPPTTQQPEAPPPDIPPAVTLAPDTPPTSTPTLSTPQSSIRTLSTPTPNTAPSLLPTPPPPLVTTGRTPYTFTTLSTIKPGCGSCGIVASTTSQPGVRPKFNFQNPVFKNQPSSNDSPNVDNKNHNLSPAGPAVPSVPLLSRSSLDLNLPGNNKVNVGINTERNETTTQIELSTNLGVTTPKVNFQNPGSKNQQSPLNELINQNEISLTTPGGPTASLVPLFSRSSNDLITPGNNKDTAISREKNKTAPTKFSSHEEAPKPQAMTNKEIQPAPTSQPTVVNPKTEDHKAVLKIGDNRRGKVLNSPQDIPASRIPQTPPHRSALEELTIKNGVIEVPGNDPIPIKDKYPNMVDGLPKGISPNDITDLLYKFNYTLGFHGHYEKGLKDGSKIGGYFVNGRDGYSRVVTYVADELGYRPKFSLIYLGLDSPDTPKAGDEKTFGLKGFEFVWYPVK